LTSRKFDPDSPEPSISHYKPGRALFNSLDEVYLTRIDDPLQFANQSGDILFVPDYYASKFPQ